MAIQLSADEERDLIADTRQNPNAFRVLYRAYFPRVYGYVAYRVGRVQDAEDVTSAIFTKVIEALDTFEHRGEGSFAAWVFRIAHNEVQQFYRNAAHTQEIALDELPDIHGSSLQPDEAYIQQERFMRLRMMLRSLSQRRQEILTLRFLGGLRNQEIAKIIGLDERTVASHISRGLADLQTKYQQKDLG